MGKISYIERRNRNFSIKILKIEKRKRICLQNLINREEKEKFFLTILKFEKRKRIWFSNSWKSRKEREMKIQFSRPREKKMSHFSRHFSRDRDSCHRLAPVWAHASSVVLKRYSTRYNWCIVFKTTLLPEESYSWECACRALPTVWDWTWIMKGTMSIGVMKATRGRKLQWGLWGVQFPSKLEVTADFHIYGLGSAFIKLVSTFQNIAERAWLWDSIGTK